MHAILWWQKAPFLLALHGYATPRMKANRFLIMSNDNPAASRRVDEILSPLLRRGLGCLQGGNVVMPQYIAQTFQTRRALLRSLMPYYQQASSAQKTLLLDAFVEWTGYIRKHAIKLLN